MKCSCQQPLLLERLRSGYPQDSQKPGACQSHQAGSDKPVAAGGPQDGTVATRAAVTGLPLVSPRASSAILMFAIAGAIILWALARWGYRVWVPWGVGR